MDRKMNKGIDKEKTEKQKTEKWKQQKQNAGRGAAASNISICMLK